jgi:hypothetical protein
LSLDIREVVLAGPMDVPQTTEPCGGRGGSLFCADRFRLPTASVRGKDSFSKGKAVDPMRDFLRLLGFTRLSSMHDGPDQCRCGDAMAGSGIKGLFPVTEETFDWSERATTSL